MSGLTLKEPQVISREKLNRTDINNSMKQGEYTCTKTMQNACDDDQMSKSGIIGPNLPVSRF